MSAPGRPPVRRQYLLNLLADGQWHQLPVDEWNSIRHVAMDARALGLVEIIEQWDGKRRLPPLIRIR